MSEKDGNTGPGQANGQTTPPADGPTPRADTGSPPPARGPPTPSLLPQTTQGNHLCYPS